MQSLGRPNGQAHIRDLEHTMFVPNAGYAILVSCSQVKHTVILLKRRASAGMRVVGQGLNKNRASV
jgi:hypothetical protein